MKEEKDRDEMEVTWEQGDR